MDFLRVFQFPGNKDKSLLDMTLNSNLKKKKKKPQQQKPTDLWLVLKTQYKIFIYLESTCHTPDKHMH